MPQPGLHRYMHRHVVNTWRWWMGIKRTRGTKTKRATLDMRYNGKSTSYTACFAGLDHRGDVRLSFFLLVPRGLLLGRPPYLHHERDHVATRAAAEAVVGASGLVHREGRSAVLVEGATAHHAPPSRLHVHVPVEGGTGSSNNKVGCCYSDLARLIWGYFVAS